MHLFYYCKDFKELQDSVYKGLFVYILSLCIYKNQKCKAHNHATKYIWYHFSINILTSLSFYIGSDIYCQVAPTNIHISRHAMVYCTHIIMQQDITKVKAISYLYYLCWASSWACMTNQTADYSLWQAVCNMLGLTVWKLLEDSNITQATYNNALC